MILSMSNQFYLFLLTVGIGFFTGFIFDLFRIIRKIVKHPSFLIQIEDILFWLIVTFIMFRFMITKNFGEIRGFLIIGLFIGMILYFATISEIFITASMKVMHIIEKVIMTIIKIILFPIKNFNFYFECPI